MHLDLRLLDGTSSDNNCLPSKAYPDVVAYLVVAEDQIEEFYVVKAVRVWCGEQPSTESYPTLRLLAGDWNDEFQALCSSRRH